MGASIVQIACHGLGHGRQERQGEGCTRLWPDDRQCAGFPIDVVEPQADSLTRSKAVGAHHQQERVIAQTNWCRPIHGLQQPLHILPGERPPRSLKARLYRRDHRFAEIDGNAPAPMQKTQETANTARNIADVRPGISLSVGDEKSVDISQAYR
nr:hypothetical protein [Mesorhizobium sp.]